MTRKRFQKLCMSIGCPPKQARTFKIFPNTFAPRQKEFVKDLLGYDCTTYQGNYDFIVYLTQMRPWWFTEMEWNTSIKKTPIFHWDRGRRASFSIDDACINEEVLREYVYSPT